MRYETHTVRVGEAVGPVDWDHPTAKDMPPVWREAEKNPAGFDLVTDNGRWEIYAICMYDGWPYWKPTPAVLHRSPVGGGTWSFFDSYGVRKNSVQPRRETPPARGGRDG